MKNNDTKMIKNIGNGTVIEKASQDEQLEGFSITITNGLDMEILNGCDSDIAFGSIDCIACEDNYDIPCRCTYPLDGGRFYEDVTFGACMTCKGTGLGEFQYNYYDKNNNKIKYVTNGAGSIGLTTFLGSDISEKGHGCCIDATETNIFVNDKVTSTLYTPWVDIDYSDVVNKYVKDTDESGEFVDCFCCITKVTFSNLYKIPQKNGIKIDLSSFPHKVIDLGNNNFEIYINIDLKDFKVD